jgi:hypothetical protein
MLQRFFLKRAARHYARKIPEQLVRDYGSRKSYTGPQIQHAISKLKLNSRYAFLAYARFLEEEDFHALLKGAEPLSYREARDMFRTYEPMKVSSGGDVSPAPEVTGG